jgi:hypothetical protein
MLRALWTLTEQADVSCAQPPMPIEGCVRGLRVIQVADEQAWRLESDLAWLFVPGDLLLVWAD